MAGPFPAEANGGEPRPSAAQAPPEGGGGVAAEAEGFWVEGGSFGRHILGGNGERKVLTYRVVIVLLYI